MNDSLPYHVFAHQGGRYQTTESAGISDSEAKALEQFFFGQTNSDAYLRSLDNDPGIIWRVVSGKGALTRVTAGNPDGNERVTLNFETVLIPNTLLRSLADQLATIVFATWRSTPQGVSVSRATATVPGKLHPDRVSDVLMAVHKGKRVIRQAADFSVRDVAAIIRPCIDFPQFSLCYKSLNKSAPVSVNLVALDVPEKIMPAMPSVSAPERPAPLPNTPDVRPVGAANLLVVFAVYAALIVQIAILWFRQPPAVNGSVEKVQAAITSHMERSKDDLIKKIEESQSTGNKDNQKRIDELASEIKEQRRHSEVAVKSLDTKLVDLKVGLEDGLKIVHDKQDGTLDKLDDLKEQIKKIGEDVQKSLTKLNAKIDEHPNRAKEDTQPPTGE